MRGETLELSFDAQAPEGQRHGSGKRPWRVAEVNRAVRSSLETSWPDLWVEGELSDVTRAASGHLYFTLNDEIDPAQVRGVIFRGDARRIRTTLVDGARVKMRGALSLYEPRGSFQLIARTVLEAGLGDLAAEFARVRDKLAAEGLLDRTRKRPLPRLPRLVGVVTSRSGAALHDIVRVARGRCPVHIVVADCRVQGGEAPASIVAALRALVRIPQVDVVIIARGGGNAEDLWAFNSEAVARAIVQCPVPTVTGIGHEVDITIADLVADVRCSTPSNAAELVVPDRDGLRVEVESRLRRLERAFETRLGRLRLRLERLGGGLYARRHSVAETRARVSMFRHAAVRLTERRLQKCREALQALHERLRIRDPRRAFVQGREVHISLKARLQHAMRPALVERRRRLLESEAALKHTTRARLAGAKAGLDRLATGLDALSPLKVLGRGYAIAFHDSSGKALVRASDASAGDSVTIRLSEGKLRTRVEGQDS